MDPLPPPILHGYKIGQHPLDTMDVCQRKTNKKQKSGQI